MKEIIIDDKKISALIDTGSKFNIMSQKVYEIIGKPVLYEAKTYLAGFGQNKEYSKIKPRGYFKINVEIDSKVFNLKFYVVSNECCEFQAIIGREFFENAEITINSKGISVKKIFELQDQEEFPNIMKIDVVKEEITMANEEMKASKLIKRVPREMSDYQACWIPDVEQVNDDNDGESEDENSEEEYMSCESEADSNDEMEDSNDEMEEVQSTVDEQQFDTVTVSEGPVNDEKYDLAMDLQEERETLRKIKEARTDQLWPDEIDTPLDVPARERFQKYRGLEAFRKSPWDPKENLPSDYARIYQFKNDRNDLRKNAKKQILNVQNENRRSYKLRRKKPFKYKEGDLVAIKRTQFGGGLKLKSKFLGPYRVSKIKVNDTYDLYKDGTFEGPTKTTSCAEYMKLWRDGEDNELEKFGTNLTQDGRGVRDELNSGWPNCGVRTGTK